MRSERIWKTAAVVAATAVLLTGCASGDADDSPSGLDTEALSGESQEVIDELTELYDAAIDNGETEVALSTYYIDQLNQRSQVGEGRIAQLFEDTFPGISVTGLDVSETTIRDRVDAENASGNHVVDVAIDGDTEILSLKESGDLLQFTPAGAADIYSDSLVDEDGYAFSPFRIYNGLTYNTQLIGADALPTTWADLAGSDYTDKFIVNVRNVLAERAVIAGIYNGVLTEEEFVAALQNGVISEDYADQGTGVIQGEYEFSLFYAGSYALASKATGVPIEWADSDFTFANPHWSAVLADAPHPNAAKLFEAFLYTQLVQDAYSDETYFISNFSGTVSNPLWPEVAEKKIIPFNEIPSVLAEYESIVDQYWTEAGA